MPEEPFIQRINRDRYACGHTDVDEIVADGKIHLERMSAVHVWIGLSDGGEVAHINLNSETPISISLEPEGNAIGEETWNQYDQTWEEAGIEDGAEVASFEDLVKLAEAILAKNYPADVFLGESGDAGPRFIVKLREALEELQNAG